MTPCLPRLQRGAATLIIALVLLVGFTMFAFFANRSIVFEQRTSANQYRSTKALATAEAGLEWALAQLNSPVNLAYPSCSTTSGTRTFRDNYLDPSNLSVPAYGTASGAFSTAQPSCARQLNSASWSCSCPVGTSTSTGAPTCDVTSGDNANGCAKFVVSFTRIQDPSLGTTCASGTWTNCVTSAVKITSVGYTDMNGTPDGTATISQMYKTVSGLATQPAAALTAKTNVDVSGNFSADNYDTTSNGITINSGGPTSFGGSASVTTLPGTPPAASVYSND